MYKRVLIPLDSSSWAEQALPHAIAQARHSQAELILLKVVEPFPHARGLSLGDLKRIEQQAITWAREYLERLADDVRQQGIPVQAVITDGRPHIEIPQYAETHQVDLIVMSTRGQSGLSRWLMGSVADRVVRGATVPVLLVRAQKEEAQGDQM
jgi:nucleotide-binding universal stress UspA family protein